MTTSLEGHVISYPGTGPSHDGARSHQCIILKDDLEAGDLYLVPICSLHGTADTTVVLDQNTRGLSLTRKSYIGYYQAKKVGRKGVLARRDSGELAISSDPIPMTLLDKVKAGVRTSKEIEPWFRKAFS